MLSQVFRQKDIVVGHLGVAKEMLSDKKVLAVLDEVDSWWQLEEMAKQRGWFGPRSILIITTEDRKPLKQFRLGIDHIYEMKFPTKDESLRILCQYAFGQNSPYDGFESLAREVTWLAGDLPLALRVMGSYLRGMSREEWIDALPRLRSSLDREIESTLRFSYDSLTEKDQAIFLHIACFFEYSTVDRVKSCLEKSGLEVNHGLQVLADKSLISRDRGDMRMHSLLRQMGREIVKKHSLEEPGKRQFLWDANAISYVLEGDTGTGKILGIKLDLSNREEIQVSKSAFDGMNNLRFLELGIFTQLCCTPEGLNCLPDKLRLIHWNWCPLRIWPSKFSGKFLVELIMQESNLEKLWEGIKPLQCLKVMDLSSSKYLKEIPDLSKATSLEKLDLHDCKSLLEMTSSIGNATNLTDFELYGCKLLKKLPSSIGRLFNLDASKSLKELNLRHTGIEEMTSSMRTWSYLYSLDMSGCRNLKKFPNVPDSIQRLLLCNTGIEEIPPWIGKLFRLRILNMDRCYWLKKISPNIYKLENLEFLSLCNRKDNEEKFSATIKWGSDLNRCWYLETTFKVDYILPICLPENVLLSSPISIYFNCEGFKTIPDCIRSFSGLSKLGFRSCKELEALPPFPGSLQSIDAYDCGSLKRIDSSPFLKPYICLNFSHCYNLNQKARKLITTSAYKYALLPGIEVPAYFTHRATSGSLTINLTPRPLPSSFRFKVCILLSYQYSMREYPLNEVSCCVRGKRSDGRPIEHRSSQHRLPYLRYLPCRPYPYNYNQFVNHLYTFEDSFCLNHDFPEAKEATFSELSFEFIVHCTDWKVKGCGVRLLDIPHCILDGNEDDDDDDDDDEDKDESADDGEGSLRRRKACFNYPKKKGKSDTKRVLKGSVWSIESLQSRESSSSK